MAEKAVLEAAQRGLALPEGLTPPTVEQQILDFLEGRSNGAALLDILYGDTLDELLPPKLTDLLRGWRPI